MLTNHTHPCIHFTEHTCTHAYLYIHLYSHLYTHIHTHTHIYTYTHLHTSSHSFTLECLLKTAKGRTLPFNLPDKIYQDELGLWQRVTYTSLEYALESTLCCCTFFSPDMLLRSKTPSTIHNNQNIKLADITIVICKKKMVVTEDHHS